MEKPLTSVRRESMDLAGLRRNTATTSCGCARSIWETGAKRRTRCRTPSFVR